MNYTSNAERDLLTKIALENKRYLKASVKENLLTSL